MGLCEKVTIVLVTVVVIQITISNCMPSTSRKVQRHLDNFRQTKYNPVTKSPLTKGVVTKKSIFSNGKNVKTNKYTPATKSMYQEYNFPEIEYPHDTSSRDPFSLGTNVKPGPIDLPNKRVTNSQSTAINHLKKEMRMKRKLNRMHEYENYHSKREMPSISKPAPGSESIWYQYQDTFPEVQYPMSAQETWGPHYWNPSMLTQKEEQYDFPNLPVYDTKISEKSKRNYQPFKQQLKSKTQLFMEEIQKIKEKMQNSTLQAQMIKNTADSNTTKNSTKSGTAYSEDLLKPNANRINVTQSSIETIVSKTTPNITSEVNKNENLMNTSQSLSDQSKLSNLTAITSTGVEPNEQEMNSPVLSTENASDFVQQQSIESITNPSGDKVKYQTPMKNDTETNMLLVQEATAITGPFNVKLPLPEADTTPVADTVLLPIADTVPLPLADTIPQPVAETIPPQPVAEAIPPQPVADTKPLPETNTIPLSVADTVPLSVADIKPQPVSETIPLPVADTVPLPVADTNPLRVADTKPLPEAEIIPLQPVAETIPVADTVPLPVADTKPLPVADTIPPPVADTKPLSVADTKPLPVADTKPLPVADTKPLPEADTIPLPVADKISQPVHSPYTSIIVVPMGNSIRKFKLPHDRSNTETPIIVFIPSTQNNDNPSNSAASNNLHELNTDLSIGSEAPSEPLQTGNTLSGSVRNQSTPDKCISKIPRTDKLKTESPQSDFERLPNNSMCHGSRDNISATIGMTKQNNSFGIPFTEKTVILYSDNLPINAEILEKYPLKDDDLSRHQLTQSQKTIFPNILTLLTPDIENVSLPVGSIVKETTPLKDSECPLYRIKNHESPLWVDKSSTQPTQDSVSLPEDDNKDNKDDQFIPEDILSDRDKKTQSQIDLLPIESLFSDIDKHGTSLEVDKVVLTVPVSCVNTDKLLIPDDEALYKSNNSTIPWNNQHLVINEPLLENDADKPTGGLQREPETMELYILYPEIPINHTEATEDLVQTENPLIQNVQIIKTIPEASLSNEDNKLLPLDHTLSEEPNILDIIESCELVKELDHSNTSEDVQGNQETIFNDYEKGPIMLQATESEVDSKDIDFKIVGNGLFLPEGEILINNSTEGAQMNETKTEALKDIDLDKKSTSSHENTLSDHISNINLFDLTENSESLPEGNIDIREISSFDSNISVDKPNLSIGNETLDKNNINLDLHYKITDLSIEKDDSSIMDDKSFLTELTSGITVHEISLPDDNVQNNTITTSTENFLTLLTNVSSSENKYLLEEPRIIEFNDTSIKNMSDAVSHLPIDEVGANVATANDLPVVMEIDLPGNPEDPQSSETLPDISVLDITKSGRATSPVIEIIRDNVSLPLVEENQDFIPIPENNTKEDILLIEKAEEPLPAISLSELLDHALDEMLTGTALATGAKDLEQNKQPSTTDKNINLRPIEEETLNDTDAIEEKSIEMDEETSFLNHSTSVDSFEEVKEYNISEIENDEPVSMDRELTSAELSDLIK